MGAGGKVAEGCFITVAEVDPDGVTLEGGLTHHLRQLPRPHAAGPGTPVRHLHPALRAAPPVRGRLEGHQRRAAVRAVDVTRLLAVLAEPGRAPLARGSCSGTTPATPEGFRPK